MLSRIRFFSQISSLLLQLPLLWPSLSLQKGLLQNVSFLSHASVMTLAASGHSSWPWGPFHTLQAKWPILWGRHYKVSYVVLSACDFSINIMANTVGYLSKSHSNPFLKNKNMRGFPGPPVVKLCTSTAGGASLIPGPGTKIPHSAQCGQKIINK